MSLEDQQEPHNKVGWDLGLAQGQGEVATCEGGAQVGKVGGLKPLRHVNVESG